MDNNLFGTIKESLKGQYGDVVAAILPGGKFQGNEYVCASLTDPTEAKILAILKTGDHTLTQLNRALSGHVASAKLASILGSLEAANRIAINRENKTGRKCKVITLR